MFDPPSPLACALPGGNQGIDQCHVRLECPYQRRAGGIDIRGPYIPRFRLQWLARARGDRSP